jgi:hypothetical protein
MAQHDRATTESELDLAVQIADGRTQNYFLRTFGQANREQFDRQPGGDGRDGGDGGPGRAVDDDDRAVAGD